MKTLSIIMPVRNEAPIIRQQLLRLQGIRAAGHELIVVDGGSTDSTVQQTEGLVDRCEHSSVGRSRQMNAGAAVASGDILLFLHADTELPTDAVEQLIGAMQSQGRRWGWFDVRLSGARPAFTLLATMMNRRARLTSVCSGDQALFVERALFQQIAGFPRIALMEDIAISKALRRLGRPARPVGIATTSSRRWQENGLLATIVLMWKLRLLYFIGVSPARLVELYYPQALAREPQALARENHGRARLAVFAREPRLGQVKSRLAVEIGEPAALAVYEAMLRRLGTLLNQAGLAAWELWVTSNTSHERFLSLCNKKDIHLQLGQDLGARMSHTLQQTLRRGDTDVVVLIGTDCPALTADYLHRALSALEAGTDVVLGPAEDGGYVLIGARAPIPELFEGISWGSDQVLAQTLVRLEASQLSCQLLETLWDVDRPEDLARLRQLEPPLHWG
ncbi:MAG: TIGR04283 family arsenosugar biosynthesis glycosyltransferase [Pseudohongiellaceae bacterium]